MVVTKVTGFSISRQHSRGHLTTVAVVVVVTKVTAFSSILYITTTIKIINKQNQSLWSPANCRILGHFRH
jgi:hypothetical protein